MKKKIWRLRTLDLIKRPLGFEGHSVWGQQKLELYFVVVDYCWWFSVQMDRLHVVVYKSARWWVTLEFMKIVQSSSNILFTSCKFSRQLTLLIIMHGVCLSIFNYFTIHDIRGLMCLSFSVYTLLIAIFIPNKNSWDTVTKIKRNNPAVRICSFSYLTTHWT